MNLLNFSNYIIARLDKRQNIGLNLIAAHIRTKDKLAVNSYTYYITHSQNRLEITYILNRIDELDIPNKEALMVYSNEEYARTLDFVFVD